MAEYATYSETFNSGVEWLGNIPADWQAMPIAALLEERGETNKGLKTENVLSVLRDVGVIPYEEKGDIGNKKSEDIERYKVVYPGDLVVNSMNVIIGSVGVSAYYGSLSPVYIVLKPRRMNVIHKKFVGYAFQIKTFQRWLKRLGYGILEHRLRIPMDNLKREYLPVPPYEVQEHIAAFLDHETAKIDRLITKQERLIELLKEKRQAVISHAVIKGLNPDAPMKDSGAEWLGEVPAHWVVKKLRRCVIEHKQGYYSSDSYVDVGIKLLRITDFRELGRVSFENCPLVEALPTIGSFTLRKGDFVFARTGGAGSFALIEDIKEQVIFASYLIRFRFKGELKPGFLRYYFLSDPFQVAVRQNIHGGVNQNLHAEDIKEQSVTVPPKREQGQILVFLDDMMTKYKQLIDKATHNIELLQEHRTALIYAAVTGKIDVRDWQKSDTQNQEAATAASA